MFSLPFHIAARPFAPAFFLCAGLALAGCGGGGGGSSSSGAQMRTCTNGDGGTVMVPTANACPTTRTCSDGSTIAFNARCPTGQGGMTQCPGSTTMVPTQSIIEDTAALCTMETGITARVCPGTIMLVLNLAECTEINNIVDGFIDSPNATCPDGSPVPATGPCPMCPPGEAFNEEGECETEITSCPNPGDVIIRNVCQVLCPNGTTLPSGEECPITPIRNPTPHERPCTAPPLVDTTDYELRTNCPLTLTRIEGAPEESNGEDTYTGDGVLVGVIDSRLDTAHVEFQDHPGTFTVDNAPSVTFTEDGRTYTVAATQPDPDQHGNGVTGILAAKKDDEVRSLNMRGVAYGSDIIFLGTGDFIEPDHDTRPLPETLNSTREFYNAFAGELMKRFIARGARVVTRSFTFFPEGVPVPNPEIVQCPDPLGGPNPCAVVDTTRFTRTQLENNGVFRLAEAMFPPTDRNSDAYATHPIFVVAAGNDGLPNPDVSFGLTHQYAELRDHFVTVVAVGTDGVIAGFSNRCGVVADWCIAAPGVRIVVPTFGNTHRESWIGPNGGGYRFVNGTSFAAPIVAGALALMVEAFGDGTPSDMRADEILDRLYATADKTSRYADSATYGQGLLDIGAALDPTGTTTLRAGLGRTDLHLRDAARFDVGASRIFLSHAFGNALSRALGGREAVFFDELDAAFAFPARTLFHTNPVHDPFRRLRRATQAELAVLSGPRATLAVSLGYDAPVAAALDDYFNFVRDGPSLALRMDVSGTQHLRASLFMGRARETQSLTDEAPPDTYGAHIAYGVSLARLSLELEAGWLLETDQILGAYPQGAFAHEGSTPTLFAGVAGAYALGRNWEGRAHARVGRTEPDALSIAQSGLHDITPLTSSAFSAGVYRRNLFAWGDALGFVVAQPLRIEDGSAELTYATGRTRNKILLEETLDIPLAPSGRAVDMELVYQGAHMMLSAGATLNARHEAGRTDAHVAVRLFRSF